MPVTIVRGAAPAAGVGSRPQPLINTDPVGERNEAERRLSALAEAVRDHQNQARRRASSTRYHDEELYRRLRQICGRS